MGYTTTFWGSFSFNKPIDEKLVEYINLFSGTRHMGRDNELIQMLYPNWREMCYNGELGAEGEYFLGPLGSCDFLDDYFDPSVLDYNRHPKSQPGLWCHWVIENRELVWDGGEKFYDYVEWLKYLIERFFAPNGYVLNGSVEFDGEDASDHGVIKVSDNAVEVEYRVFLSEVSDSELLAEAERRGLL